MILYEKYKPLLKRVPTVVDNYDDVQRYDSDNLYPQRCKEIIARSYTLKSALAVLKDFINGEGFVDPALNTLIVNEKGEYGGTLRDVLNKVCETYSEFTGTALHIGYDLNYSMSSITPIPWEYARMGIADDDGNVDEIRYSTNWERDMMKSKNTTRKIVSYYTFNPDPEVVRQQIEDCDGIENYKGQIIYWTPEEGQYPKATFDPILEHAQAQGELGEYKIGNLQNGFMATTIVVVPETNSTGEKSNLIDDLRKKKGSKGANGILGIETNNPEFDIDKMIKTLSPANVDRQWEYTETSSAAAIMENYAMPKELLGVRPETGMFNQENMENAYVYFNSITRNKRAEISRFFAYLMKYWQTPIVADFKIKEQRYIVEETTALPGQPATSPIQNEIDTVIRSLSRRDLSKLYGYVNDFKKGRANLEQTKVFLRAFKLTDQQIELFLNDDPNDDPQLDG
jgi:hypothetical protein